VIQQQPFCFGCEAKVERLEEAVFAPPWCDHEDCSSAVFHGICLMSWRERRQELRLQMQRRMEAFRRHAEGECDCSDG
jgi:hypothetical protein